MNIEEVHKHLNNGGWLTNGREYIKGLGYHTWHMYRKLITPEWYKRDNYQTVEGVKLQPSGMTKEMHELPENITTWTIPQQERY